MSAAIGLLVLAAVFTAIALHDSKPAYGVDSRHNKKGEIS